MKCCGIETKDDWASNNGNFKGRSRVPSSCCRLDNGGNVSAYSLSKLKWPLPALVSHNVLKRFSELTSVLKDYSNLLHVLFSKNLCNMEILQLNPTVLNKSIFVQKLTCQTCPRVMPHPTCATKTKNTLRFLRYFNLIT